MDEELEARMRAVREREVTALNQHLDKKKQEEAELKAKADARYAFEEAWKNNAVPAIQEAVNWFNDRMAEAGIKADLNDFNGRANLTLLYTISQAETGRGLNVVFRPTRDHITTVLTGPTGKDIVGELPHPADLKSKEVAEFLINSLGR